MIASSLVALLSLSIIIPTSAAPLATSTVIRIPDVVTMTVGFIAPTEMPNPDVSDLTETGNRLPIRLPSQFDHSNLLARQIRIDNYDATGNMSWPALGDSKLLKRNKKSEAEDRNRVQALEADAATPSASPQSFALASPMKASTSAMQALGETRTNASNVFHSVLGTVFSGSSNASDSSSTTHYTYTKGENDTPMPAGPGYTTDTMNVPSPKAPARRDVGHEAITRVEELGLPHGKRHTMMLDTNALLPEPPSTDTSALPGPTPAWENMGLINLDSNRSPPPLDVPQNITGAATNVTDAAPADIEQAPAAVSSAA